MQQRIQHGPGRAYRTPHNPKKQEEKKQREQKHVHPDDGDSSDEGQAKAKDDVEAKLYIALEQLSEKRMSTRFEGLDALLKGLTETDGLAFLERHGEGLTETILKIIRKGDSELVVRAMKVLCLAATTLGEDGIGAARIFSSCWKTLEAFVKDATKPSWARAVAIETLGLLCFVGAQEPEEEQQVIETFEDIYRLSTMEDCDELVAQALESHGFLLSGRALRVLCGPTMAKYTKTWMNFLDHESLSIRAMAGENLALICGAHCKKARDQGDQLNAEEVMPWISSAIEKMKEFVKDSNHKVSRETRKKQRSLFREMLSTLLEGEQPSEQIKVGKNKLVFVGWAKVKQLGMFRSILGSGLPGHLRRDVIFRELFADELLAAAIEINETEAAVERLKKPAAVYAEAHKFQSQARSKGRATKEALQHVDEDAFS